VDLRFNSISSPDWGNPKILGCQRDLQDNQSNQGNPMGLKIKGIDIREITPFQDERGSLIKVLMCQHLGENHQTFGEIYINTALPGAVKGNHYHVATSEWFCVLSGQMALGLVDTQTGMKDKIVLNGDAPKVVHVPPCVAHAFKNIGEDVAIFLAYADFAYDPNQPDMETFAVFSAFK
jgi:dTDP-4-dehydrorhamnose 3,5-epimerase-like enzyme